jgi:hypothetical protein
MAAERWTSSMIEAYQYAVAFRQRGFTAAEAVGLFRESGMRIGTTDFNRVWRVAGEFIRSSTDVSEGQAGKYVPASIYTEVDLDYSKRYVHIVEMKGYDTKTGKQKSVYVTAEFDRRPTWDDVIEEAEYVIRLSPERYLIEAPTVRKIYSMEAIKHR